jgi:hypothetical protein
MLAADLPNSHFYVIPGMGHGATVGNACSLKITMEFLSDPSKAPDSSCLEETAFEFFLPYDGSQPVAVEPLKDPTHRFKGVVPAGWKKELDKSVYSRRAYLFDPTMVEFEVFPSSKDMAIYALASSGFDGPPRKTDSHSANGLNWSIYSSKYNGEPMMLALAEVSPSQTLVVIMVVSAPERDAFYNGLFIPILDAYAPQE